MTIPTELSRLKTQPIEPFEKAINSPDLVFDSP